MTKIHPQDVVPDGTAILVANKGKAVVHHSEQATDQHGLPITVHYVQYPDGKVHPCNYSFILLP